tara:strand:+ start:3179 stop:4423 length:1245 start_codon:yes stop_codon:yes gene_type:complete
MKIDFIIPTLFRDTLKKSKKSIIDENLGSENTNIFINGSGSSAGENRNFGLQRVKNSDWIVFLDDDDYLVQGFSKQLDSNFDIVVLRMLQENKYIPSKESKVSDLVLGNVGINFAIKTSFYLKNKIFFDHEGLGEDFRFLQKLINKTNKIKITENVFYIAPVSQHKKNPMKNVKYGLYIATPFNSESVNCQYMESMISTHNKLNQAGIPVINQWLYNTSLITKARNTCISNWMNKTDLEYFMFIDSDMSWKSDYVLKLMNYDKIFVAGTYSKKHLNWYEIQKNFINGVSETSKDLIEKTSEYTCYEKKDCTIKDGLLEVNRVGTGFMMFKRSLIYKLEEKYPELIYYEHKEKQWGFFQCDIKDKEHLSEDYAFCERVKSVGEKILIDPDLDLVHHGGNVSFYSNFKNYMSGNTK